MTVSQAEKTFFEVMQKAKETGYIPTEIELTQHQWLHIKTDYKNATREEMQNVLDFIKQLKSEARNKIFERMEADKEKIEQAVERLQKSIAGLKKIDVKRDIKKRGLPTSLGNFLNYWAHDWNTILRKVITDNAISEEYGKKVERAQLRYYKLWNEHNAKKNQIYAQAYNINATKSEITKAQARMLDDFEFNLLGSDNQIHTDKLTRQEIMSLYGMAKNEEAYNKLTDPEIHSYSEQGLNTIFAVLTEQDKRFVDLAMDYFKTD
jgi:hypothetical protein